MKRWLDLIPFGLAFLVGLAAASAVARATSCIGVKNWDDDGNLLFGFHESFVDGVQSYDELPGWPDELAGRFPTPETVEPAPVTLFDSEDGRFVLVLERQ